MHTTFRRARVPTTTGSTVTGPRIAEAILGLPDTGTGGHSTADTKSRRALTTTSMIATTGQVLLAGSHKIGTQVSIRVEVSAGRTAIKAVDSTKARHAILGGIKTRHRIVEMT